MAIKLPPRAKLQINRKNILIYRFIGCSHAAIAQEYEVSAKSVSSYLSRYPMTEAEEKVVAEEAKKMGDNFLSSLSPSKSTAQKTTIKTKQQMADREAFEKKLLDNL